MYYIYQISNSLSNKQYIGQTTDHNRRWSDHKSYSRSEPVQYIHRAMAKHGIDNFTFEVIACCWTQEDADFAETECIRDRKTLAPNGYNLTTGGGHFNHSDETKALLSQKKTAFYQRRLEETGSKITDAERQTLSESHKGIIPSDETRAKMSAKSLGRKYPERPAEWSRKISEGNKGRPAWNKGTKGVGTTGYCKFSKEQQATICESYKELTSRQIAIQYGCSPTTIIKILRLNNILT